MAQLSRRDTAPEPDIWRRGAFNPPIDPEEPPPPLTEETAKTTVGWAEQVGHRVGTFLNRPLPACSHLHAAGGMASSRTQVMNTITNGIAQQLADPWLPRLCLMGGLILANTASQGPGAGEEYSKLLNGDYDTWFEDLADLIYTSYDPILGDTHPVTGRTITMDQLLVNNWIHESTVGGSPWVTRLPNNEKKLSATPENASRGIRHALNVMWAQQPDLAMGESHHPLCLVNHAGATGYPDHFWKTWPGDDYGDLVGLDVYDSAGQPNTAGTPAYWAKSRAEILTDRPLSLQGMLIPFSDAIQTHPYVAAVNAATGGSSSGTGNNGGRHVAIPWCMIEWGVYASDKDNNGQPDNAGGLDNPGYADTMYNLITAELAKTHFGRQITYGARVLFHNPFDINDGGARTSHKFTSYPDGTKYAYHFANFSTRMRTLFGGA